MASEFTQYLNKYIEDGITQHSAVFNSKLWEKTPALIAQQIADQYEAFKDVPPGSIDKEVRRVVGGILRGSGFSDAAKAEVRVAVASYIKTTRRFYEGLDINVTNWETAIRNHAIFKRSLLNFQNQFSELGQQAAGDLEALIKLGIARGEDREKIGHSLRNYTGKLGVYGRTIAFTAVSGFHQATPQIVAEKAGLKNWYYAGNIMKTTRVFCNVAHGYIYSQAQIEEMLNGQIEPVATYKGGYNCRHQLIPVRPKWGDFKRRKKLPTLLTNPDELRVADKAKRKAGR
jgi:hypothetical protein